MDRRTYLALLAGGFTTEQGILLGVLGSRRMAWAELLEAASSSARPSRAWQEALGALDARGVVVLGDDDKLSLAPPAAWMDRHILRKVDAALAKMPRKATRIAPPAVEEDHPAVARCRAVFGDEVAEKLRRRWPLVVRDLRGKDRHFLAAIAVCEINEFDPQDPIAYLVKTARDLIAGGEIPDFLEDQLRAEPTQVRRPPPPPPKVFKADEVDWNPPGAVSPAAILKQWRKRKRKLLEGRRDA